MDDPLYITFSQQYLPHAGMNEDVLYAGFQAQFFDFLENYETPLDFSPLDAVKALNKAIVFFSSISIYSAYQGFGQA